MTVATAAAGKKDHGTVREHPWHAKEGLDRRPHCFHKKQPVRGRMHPGGETQMRPVAQGEPLNVPRCGKNASFKSPAAHGQPRPQRNQNCLSRAFWRRASTNPALKPTTAAGSGHRSGGFFRPALAFALLGSPGERRSAAPQASAEPESPRAFTTCARPGQSSGSASGCGARSPCGPPRPVAGCSAGSTRRHRPNKRLQRYRVWEDRVSGMDGMAVTGAWLSAELRWATPAPQPASLYTTCSPTWQRVQVFAGSARWRCASGRSLSWICARSAGADCRPGPLARQQARRGHRLGPWAVRHPGLVAPKHPPHPRATMATAMRSVGVALLAGGVNGEASVDLGPLRHRIAIGHRATPVPLIGRVSSAPPPPSPACPPPDRPRHRTGH